MHRAGGFPYIVEAEPLLAIGSRVAPATGLGRYITIPGVINRITCRHRRNLRGPQPFQESAPHLVRRLWAVHNFPDAQAALNEVLARYPRTYPGPAARDPPFP